MNDWERVYSALMAIDQQTPIAVAIVVARAAAAMCNVTNTIAKELEATLELAKQKIDGLETEVYLLRNVKPIKSKRKTRRKS